MKPGGDHRPPAVRRPGVRAAQAAWPCIGAGRCYFRRTRALASWISRGWLRSIGRRPWPARRGRPRPHPHRPRPGRHRGWCRPLEERALNNGGAVSAGRATLAVRGVPGGFRHPWRQHPGRRAGPHSSASGRCARGRRTRTPDRLPMSPRPAAPWRLNQHQSVKMAASSASYRPAASLSALPAAF